MPGPLGACLAKIAPFRELARHAFLDGLPVGEIDRSSRSRTDEVGLVEREGLRQRGSLDEPADPVRRGWCKAEPLPAALDDLAKCADGEPAILFSQRPRITDQIARRRGPPLPRQTHADG